MDYNILTNKIIDIIFEVNKRQPIIANVKKIRIRIKSFFMSEDKCCWDKKNKPDIKLMNRNY